MVKIFFHLFFDIGIADTDCLFQICVKAFFDGSRIIFFKCPAEVLQPLCVSSYFCRKPVLNLFLKYPLDLFIRNNQLCQISILRTLLRQITGCNKSFLLFCCFLK